MSDGTAPLPICLLFGGASVAAGIGFAIDLRGVATRTSDAQRRQREGRVGRILRPQVLLPAQVRLIYGLAFLSFGTV